MQLSPPPLARIPAAPSPKRERMICFSCCPDLWATLFFIYLHKLSKVTGSFPEVRDSVNTSGSQVSRPAQRGRGYRRSLGNGQWVPVSPRLSGPAWGFVRQTGRGDCVQSARSVGSEPGPSLPSQHQSRQGDTHSPISQR